MTHLEQLILDTLKSENRFFSKFEFYELIREYSNRKMNDEVCSVTFRTAVKNLVNESGEVIIGVQGKGYKYIGNENINELKEGVAELDKKIYPLLTHRTNLIKNYNNKFSKQIEMEL